jgi:hypothetical protein
MWGSWWTKRHEGRFSSGNSVSLANQHSTNFSIIIITRGWHSRPIGGRSAEWTKLDSTPHYTNLRSTLILFIHLSLGLPSGLISSGFPTNILYAFVFSPIRTICPAHLILTKTVCISYLLPYELYATNIDLS